MLGVIFIRSIFLPADEYRYLVVSPILLTAPPPPQPIAIGGRIAAWHKNRKCLTVEVVPDERGGSSSKQDPLCCTCDVCLC